MRTCDKCGKETDVNNRFCEHCGKKLKASLLSTTRQTGGGTYQAEAQPNQAEGQPNQARPAPVYSKDNTLRDAILCIGLLIVIFIVYAIVYAIFADIIDFIYALIYFITIVICLFTIPYAIYDWRRDKTQAKKRRQAKAQS